LAANVLRIAMSRSKGKGNAKKLEGEGVTFEQSEPGRDPAGVISISVFRKKRKAFTTKSFTILKFENRLPLLKITLNVVLTL
jgi:hypothetical protein